MAVIAVCLTAFPAWAALVPPECATGEAPVSECGLASLIGVFVRVAQFIFGIAGSIALAMFVYGGFVWLTSAGSPDKITKGKNILVQTIIALAIIFGAYTGVQFLTEALVGGPAGETGIFEGQSCEGANKIRGTVFRIAGELECIAGPNGCDELQSEGYTCRNPAGLTDCIAGICPGGEDNVCCRGEAAKKEEKKEEKKAP